jgi:hypothetical protein
MAERQNGAATDVGISLYDQWQASIKRKQESVTRPMRLTLPSGLQVDAVRPSLLLLLRSGRIPDALASRVQELIAIAQGSGGDDAVKVEMLSRFNQDPAAFNTMWENLLDIVWMSAVVDPPFAERPDQVGIPLVEVDLDDKNFLFVWCQGVDESVASFRERRAREVAALGLGSEGDAVSPPSGDSVGSGSDRELVVSEPTA